MKAKKPQTYNEILLGLRKPTAKGSVSFKDKSKYSRKPKHRKHHGREETS